ncbi:uncharacterized protein TRIADDRAFT_24287 [Trichoplax adhaerens]|uniref:non-specific serine/threonine protein kinase n=1 Tax=Trichoplax adhaerens TaxID=10228 RepID=B3RTR1_TRIAD|nr:hypothetical protein TRIADDRAFT_24287 [Trichoplax adhaerens]EDV25673.1 hypothetical protein TRIADDRAFT_24287 [Trichoplax adhaerens]|eukprot:XP_002111706.1 hypothetical protein TRIADDRAFT_24287 [Trichoplax adhaerens]
MAATFVEGWDFVQTLGEGAYGEVRLLINKDSGEAVAVKIINPNRNLSSAQLVRKEVCIHRMMNHTNIIKFYGCRADAGIQYLFLEYAEGGELYDRIEPDIGIPECQAHHYFTQLIVGVEYLHQMGVAHRDLKPENILLDSRDNLKISDFGLATLFRNRGQERKLFKRCGTVPYIAPEVRNCNEYEAQPADLWSCGIILVALLAGELPWDEPRDHCLDYGLWKKGSYSQAPWKKIMNIPLELLKKILQENVSKRYTIGQIKKDPWFRSNYSNSIKSPLHSGHRVKRMRTSDDIVGASSSPHLTSLSQPDPQNTDWNTSFSEESKTPSCAAVQHLMNGLSLSQPAQFDQMLLNDLSQTPAGSQNPLQRLCKRLTRITTNCDMECTISNLIENINLLNYQVKRIDTLQVTVSTTDRRGNRLKFKIIVMTYSFEKTVIDFRLAKGDGLEFKRCFRRIRDKLGDIVIKNTCPEKR